MLDYKLKFRFTVSTNDDVTVDVEIVVLLEKLGNF